jgi:Tol biopolymer transport system component
MRPGRSITLFLALLCLLSGGCATLNGTGSVESTGPDPGTAIAISVLSESIYLVDPTTGNRAEAVGGLLDFRSGYATWAPGHRRLAYGNHAIYLADFEKNTNMALVHGEDLSMPGWRPDANEIVYGDGVDMWTRHITSGPTTRMQLPASLAALGMDWGSNGLIAFQGLARDCRARHHCVSTDRSEIWLLDPKTQELSQVTHVGHAEGPKWSPDGSRILFIRRPDVTAAPRELWVVNADGSGAHRLGSAANVVAADWSPDGSRVAMLRASSRTGTLQLWIADAGGSDAETVGRPVRGTEATLDW